MKHFRLQDLHELSQQTATNVSAGAQKKDETSRSCRKIRTAMRTKEEKGKIVLEQKKRKAIITEANESGLPTGR